MLRRIFIQNLVTVEKQVIEFIPGFTVMTGETGAGKSIIIKAINLILGEKCPKDLIRSGESFLSVEAVFSIAENSLVKELLSQLDIEHEEELTIRRKVHISGKSSVFINDYTSKLSTLSELGKDLIDLHGQHSQQSLLQPASHVDYLDQFSNLQESVKQFQTMYQELLQKRKISRELEQSVAERERTMDFIRFQIDEIEHSAFTTEEETQLNEEFRLLSNGEQIIGALSPIAGWTSDENSPLQTIISTLQPLSEIVRLAPDLKETAAEMQSGLISLQECADDISRYLGKLEINPQKLEEVNQRLSQLDKLKRKYGETLSNVMKFKETQEVELKNLENMEINHNELSQEIVQLTETVEILAKKISQTRQEKSAQFEELVLSKLQELGLERSSFAVKISSLPADENSNQSYSMKGMDKVEFLITTNPGNPLKPLAKIASGGELSRIMLALKTTLNQDLSQATMVFDEIDAGISGRVAETVGFKLVQLGKSRQIICITHSPQIASKAGAHLRVEKTFQDNSSRTLIVPLEKKDRIEEIARFLGGNKISKKTLAVAQDMLPDNN